MKNTFQPLHLLTEASRLPTLCWLFVLSEDLYNDSIRLKQMFVLSFFVQIFYSFWWTFGFMLSLLPIFYRVKRDLSDYSDGRQMSPPGSPF